MGISCYQRKLLQLTLPPDIWVFSAFLTKDCSWLHCMLGFCEGG